MTAPGRLRTAGTADTYLLWGWWEKVSWGALRSCFHRDLRPCTPSSLWPLELRSPCSDLLDGVWEHTHREKRIARHRLDAGEIAWALRADGNILVESHWAVGNPFVTSSVALMHAHNLSFINLMYYCLYTTTDTFMTFFQGWCKYIWFVWLLNEVAYALSYVKIWFNSHKLISLWVNAIARHCCTKSLILTTFGPLHHLAFKHTILHIY